MTLALNSNKRRKRQNNGKNNSSDNNWHHHHHLRCQHAQTLYIFVGLSILLTFVSLFQSSSLVLLQPQQQYQQQPHSFDDFSPPPPPPRSYMQEAIEECEDIRKELGEYPAVTRQLIMIRREAWHGTHDGTDSIIVHHHNRTYPPVLKMATYKLGGYVYASHVGVRTPKVLYCGTVETLLHNNINNINNNNNNNNNSILSIFGQNFVIKPLKGWSARGVKVVVNGTNRLHKIDTTVKGKRRGKRRKKKNHQDEREGEGLLLTYNDLSSEYGNDTYIIVEELVESADPKGHVPPDYKFFAAEGIVEDVLFIDRNNATLDDAIILDEDDDDNNINNKNNNLKRHIQHHCGIYIYFEDDVDATSSSPSRSLWKRVPGDSGIIGDQWRLCELDDWGLGSKRQNREMLKAVQTLASGINGNYMRIDMYNDIKHGPTLGEYTAWPALGADEPLPGCLQSYLFIKHAVHSKTSEDASIVLKTFLELGPTLNGQKKANKDNPELVEALISRVLSWIPPGWEPRDNTKNGDENGGGTSGQPQHPPSLTKIANMWSDLTTEEQCQHVLDSQKAYRDRLHNSGR